MMYTVRDGDKFTLKLSGLDIDITNKEYTMLNNIIKRTITKYDCKQTYIGGRITSFCVTNGGCFECPYKEYCKEIWIDGGIRTVGDVQTALFYGADKVIVARPLIRATFDGKYTEEINKLQGQERYKDIKYKVLQKE